MFLEHIIRFVKKIGVLKMAVLIRKNVQLNKRNQSSSPNCFCVRAIV